NSKKQLEYLQKDKVKEFNNYRKNKENILIHLPYIELDQHTLEGEGGINLRNSFLFKASLSDTNLSDADLSRANLSDADLSRANLSGDNLSGAHLENSIIINNIFSKETIVLGANFNNAIIDDLEFFAHLDKNKANNIPKEKIKNK